MLRSISFCATQLKTLIKPIVNTTTKNVLSQINTTDLFYQQTRNTFILKRRNKPLLSKKGGKRKPLKSRHFIYDLVKHVDTSKHEPIQLILTSDIKKIGVKGQIVSLKPEKAYNDVLLPKLGVYANEENIQKYIVKSDEEECKLPVITRKTIAMLSSHNLSVSLSPEVPWTLEKWHIRVAFRKALFHVPEEAITLPEKPISGPDLSIEGKQFYVTVTINNSEQVKVRCNIHHLAPMEKDRTFVADFWKTLSDPIFPEDKPILDSLPLPRNQQNLM
ncbi:PREDICTED: 39S ribosomal protein L9, mitochondrial [Polistes dominula]|uniref:Large ribosomal subunit protein bL9m n=1 Tax=Polistes dominula TaxID=743375 RepID=A0ABM1IXS6_POLDO|nr:PREDICTED: 39S ribosomal protein L9, mitochondrial [Polistes dominula]